MWQDVWYLMSTWEINSPTMMLTQLADVSSAVGDDCLHHLPSLYHHRERTYLVIHAWSSQGSISRGFVSPLPLYIATWWWCTYSLAVICGTPCIPSLSSLINSHVDALLILMYAAISKLLTLTPFMECSYYVKFWHLWLKQEDKLIVCKTKGQVMALRTNDLWYNRIVFRYQSPFL